MAYRKVDEASLTAVADAIREKGGTSANLAFPFGFMDAIAAIKTGSGLPSGISALASGTYTPTSDITSYVTIQHGLGVQPNFLLIYRDKADTGNTRVLGNLVLDVPTNNMDYMQLVMHDTGALVRASLAATNDPLLTTTTFRFQCASASYPIKGGVKYQWILGIIDGI